MFSLCNHILLCRNGREGGKVETFREVKGEVARVAAAAATTSTATAGFGMCLLDFVHACVRMRFVDALPSKVTYESGGLAFQYHL